MARRHAQLFTVSADENFHHQRAAFQEDLLRLLHPCLGSAEVREEAARGICNGELPSWWRDLGTPESLELHVRHRRTDGGASSLHASGLATASPTGTSLKDGQVVALLSCKDGFAQVRTAEGKEGYTETLHLDMEMTVQRIGSGRTSLRKSQTFSREPEVMTGVCVENTQTVSVRSMETEWAWVRTEAGAEGWLQWCYLRGNENGFK